MDLISILKNVFDAVPKSVQITDITETSSGVYTVSCDTSRIKQYAGIVIADTPNFTGEYRVESVSDTAFIIKSNAGLAVSTLGTATNYLNIHFSNFQASEELNLRDHYSELSQSKKLPLLACFPNIDETPEDETLYSANLRIALFYRSDASISNFERYQNNFPYLRLLEKDLKRAFERTDGIVDFSYIKTEIPYEAQNENFKNSIEEITDIIELKYSVNYFLLESC